MSIMRTGNIIYHNSLCQTGLIFRCAAVIQLDPFIIFVPYGLKKNLQITRIFETLC